MTDYTHNLIGAFATSLSTRIESEISKLGLRSITAATSLVTIYNHPNDSIRTLGRLLNISHSGAVRLIDGLETDELVKRIKSPQDARSVVIDLTKKGKRQALQILQARERVLESVMLPLTTKEKECLLPILEKTLKYMTGDMDSARRICRLCHEGVCRPKGCPVENSANA